MADIDIEPHTERSTGYDGAANVLADVETLPDRGPPRKGRIGTPLWITCADVFVQRCEPP